MKCLAPRVLALTVFLGWGAACSESRPESGAGVVAQARPAEFSALFARSGSVRLEQPDSAPIVRISGIDQDSGGRILIGDVSEGNVKLFAPDGRLLRVIGRKGAGPGEFSAPRYPRFGPGGLIYVADAQNPRIQVFDSAGTLRGSTRLSGAGVIMGFEPLTASKYLLTVMRGNDDRALVEVDSTGRIRRQFLRIGKVNPTGQRDFELWGNVRSFFVTVASDTAYVSTTISDTLWSVHLPTGREARTRLVFPGYVPPAPPAKRAEGIQGLMAWNRSFHSASTISSAGGALFLPYVQGILNNGDPMLLLVRGTDGEWRSVSGAPPIIGAGNGRVIGILAPGQEEVELGFFQLRGHP